MKNDAIASDIVIKNPIPATIGKVPPPDIVVKIPAAVTPSKDRIHAKAGPTNATSATQGSPKIKITTDKTTAIPRPIK